MHTFTVYTSHRTFQLDAESHRHAEDIVMGRAEPIVAAPAELGPEGYRLAQGELGIAIEQD